MSHMPPIFISRHSGIFRNSRLAKIALCYLCVLATSACQKGLKDFNETAPTHFSVVLPTKETTIIRGGVDKDTLKALIKLPEQNATETDTSQYSFVWTTLSGTQVLSRKPYLTVTDFNGIDPTKNTVQLTVTERSTDLLQKVTADVFITTPTREGWMILGEKSGKAQIGMLTYTSNGYKKITDVNTVLGKNIPINGKPLSISAIGSDKKYNQSLHQWVGVSTDQEIKIFSSLDLTVETNVSQAVTNSMTPSAASPVIIEKTGYNYFMARKGTDMFQIDLYYLKSLNLPSKQPMNSISTGGVSKVFPVSGINVQVGPEVPNYAGCYYRIIYDTDSCSFVWDDAYNMYTSQTKYLPLLLPFSLKGFQPKAIRNTMATGTVTDVLYTLMHNPSTKETYFIQFLSNGLVKDVKQLSFTKASEILNSPFIEIDYNTGYVIYVKGNAVYAYDPGADQAFSLIDFGNEAISLVKFEKFNPGSSKVPGRKEVYTELFKRLVVCTYDPANPNTSGTIRLYRIPLGHQAPIAETVETGFPKIIDTDFIPIH
ncbi:hypothetical protein DVR12_26530 [Chitinophaga silvatica]|uniref:PKD-like family protein n=1 Tax=Chitinophaga silvatica TaxID=2282649 RepID=A0A3E1Y2L5_9BACT|nr:PKD-like family lipoprotein [Chitinophaga silvatica]RFS18757.1 hypothetical protein DVR12_26530 [Chitinophaga silvatica]